MSIACLVAYFGDGNVLCCEFFDELFLVDHSFREEINFLQRLNALFVRCYDMLFTSGSFLLFFLAAVLPEVL